MLCSRARVAAGGAGPRSLVLDALCRRVRFVAAGAFCGVLCSSAGAFCGVLCSSARGGQPRAERGTRWRKNLPSPLLQRSRIEVFEELLVRGAEVLELAFAAIPVHRELLGFGDLVGDSSDGESSA